LKGGLKKNGVSIANTTLLIIKEIWGYFLIEFSLMH